MQTLRPNRSEKKSTMPTKNLEAKWLSKVPDLSNWKAKRQPMQLFSNVCSVYHRSVVPTCRTQKPDTPKYFGTMVTAAVISRRRKQCRYGCRTATGQPTCGKRREYCNINETDMWKRRLWRRSRRCCLFTVVANARNFRLRKTPRPSLRRKRALPPYRRPADYLMTGPSARIFREQNRARNYIPRQESIQRSGRRTAAPYEIRDFIHYATPNIVEWRLLINVTDTEYCTGSSET